MNNIELKQQDALEFLIGVPDKSVDLVLVDPPYITSRETGMNKWVEHVEKQDAQDAEDVHTEEDWEKYKSLEEWHHWFKGGKVHIKHWAKSRCKMKQDYIKYGSIYGKKYAVKTDYGSWDSEFTLEMLEKCVKHFYRVLKDGGICIIFFDIWKISQLKDLLEAAGPKLKRPTPRKRKKDETEEEFERRRQDALVRPDKQIGFNQLRFIEWIKTNPQPLNSSRNYLTNCREIALLGIKKGSGTFNSKYDNGIYKYPIQGGDASERFHPTQKSLKLFEELITKHSNKGDVVLDCFLGSGTTAVAALNTEREFIGCEIDNGYYNKMVERLEKYKNEREKKQDPIRGAART